MPAARGNIVGCLEKTPIRVDSRRALECNHSAIKGGQFLQLTRPHDGQQYEGLNCYINGRYDNATSSNCGSPYSAQLIVQPYPGALIWFLRPAELAVQLAYVW